MRLRNATTLVVALFVVLAAAPAPAAAADTTPPTISTYTVTTTNGGSDVLVAFNSSEQLAEITANVTGDATMSLTRNDFAEMGTGPYQYEATFSPGSGTYTATLKVANDSAGNNGASNQQGSATVSGSDQTPPTIGSATLTDQTDGNGNVTDGDTVAVAVAVSDTGGSGVASVVAQASMFGADAVPLSDGNSDGTYTGTFTVDGSTSASPGTYDAGVVASDGAGNYNSARTDTLNLTNVAGDTTPPVVWNATLVDLNGGSLADGDTVRVSANATDAANGVRADVDARPFGGPQSLSLSQKRGSWYAATFTVDTATATGSGDTTLSVRAVDDVSNVNATATNALTLPGGSDTTEPVFQSAAVYDQTDGDGVLGDGDTVRVETTVTDASSLTVTADGSAFGASGSVSLSNAGGDLYVGTFTVDRASASGAGAHAISLTATDSAANTNTTTAGSLTLSQDGGAVTYANLDVLPVAPKTGETTDVYVDVTNTEQVAVEQRVELMVNGSTVATKTPVIDAGKTWTVHFTHTFSTEKDYNVSVGTEETVVTASKPVVLSSSVEYVGGTRPSKTPTVDASVTSLLDVQLRTPGTSYDLEKIGADNTTRFRINLTLQDYDPRVLIGTGGDVNWTVSPGPSAGTTNVSIVTEPRHSEGIFNPSPSLQNWPTGSSDRADTRWNATVQLAIDQFDYKWTTATQRQRVNGTILATDAQAFGTPRYTPPSNGNPGNLTLFVAGPHYTVDGNVNTGYYEAFLTDAMLSEWGVTSPDQLTAAYAGSSQAIQTSDEPGGIRVTVDLHYSSGTVELSSKDTDAPKITNLAATASDRDVTVSFDANESLGAVSVSVGGQTMTLADFTETGTGPYSYSGTVTVPSDGDYTATLDAAADAAGNDGASGQSATVTVDTSDGGPQTTTTTTTTTATTDDSATISVSATADGTGVSVSNAPGELVGAAVGRSLDGGVSLDSLTLSLGDSGTFDATVRPGRGDVPTVPRASVLSYVTVDHGETDVRRATFSFTVSGAALDARGVAPDEAVVYRYHDGDWTPLDTRAVSLSGGDYRLFATTPGFSTFAVGGPGAPEFSVTEAALGDDSVTAGDAVTVSATVENTGGSEGTYEATLSVGGDAVDAASVTLAAGESGSVTFEHTAAEAGDFDVSVDGTAAGTLSVAAASADDGTTTATATATATSDATTAETVAGETTTDTTGGVATTAASTPADTTSNGGTPGFGVAAALVALLAAALLVRRP